MKHKRIVSLDIRTGRTLVTIVHTSGKSRVYHPGLRSFDRIVRLCSTYPFGWQPDGKDRWSAIET